MAENGLVTSPNKFLSKSKWRGKMLFNDEALAKETKDKFKLNDDVVDFLKPSTNKPQASPQRALVTPRIDIAAAQRWPGASQLKQIASPASPFPSSMRPKDGSSSRRGNNLTVSFARTAPEIIGEGGDDAESPAVEVSKARRGQTPPTRTQSDRRGGSRDDSAVGGLLGIGISGGRGCEDFRPGALQRAQTSFGEVSAPLQRKMDPQPAYSPPLQDTHNERFRPGLLKRAQTGPVPAVSEGQVGDDNFRPGPLRRAPTGWDGVSADHGQLPPTPALNVAEHLYSPTESEISVSIDRRSPDPRQFNNSQGVTRLEQTVRSGQGRASFDASLHPPAQQDPRRPSTSSSVSHSLSSPPDSRASIASYYSQHPTPYAFPRPSSSSLNSYNFPSPLPRPSSSSSPANALLSTQSRPSFPDSLHLPPSRTTYSLPDSNAARLTPSPQLPPLPSPSYFPRMSPEQDDPMPLPSINSDSTQGMPLSSNLNTRPVPSPGVAPGTANDTALNDFASRVTHMKGVFRLTAEQQRPLSNCTPDQWLRASLWWFLKGRAGLKILIRDRSRSTDAQVREILTQPHVDLAKTWWIITEIVPTHIGKHDYAGRNNSGPIAAAREAGDHVSADLLESSATILANLTALVGSMSRNRVMPPHQSLIQGQDTAIWLEYPSFAPDVSSMLSGNASRSLVIESRTQPQYSTPLQSMPLADTKNDFCYARMFVSVSINTDDADTDRVTLPCVLSVQRGRTDWQIKINLCSQNELVNSCVQPGAHGNRKTGPSWENVQWKMRSRSICIDLPRGFTLNVVFEEDDFKTLRGIHEHTRKVEATLQPEQDEKLIHEVTLRHFQYTDSSNTQSFPQERIEHCRVRVFEKTLTRNEGSGARVFHRGYRLLVITSPKNKTLSSVNYDLGKDRPMDFQFVLDADGASAMNIKINEDNRKRNLYLTFKESSQFKRLYEVLNGLIIGPDESVVVAKSPLTSLSIESASQAEGFTQSGNDPLKSLQWQELSVINHDSNDPKREHASTVLSENLRMVARHERGSVTDRLNLSPGELQIRISPSGAATLSILRPPQVDLTLSLINSSQTPFPAALTTLLHTVRTAPTVRTLALPSLPALHALQLALTGYVVRFDALASSFAIARRRAVVPLYKKWEATTARVQLVRSADERAVLLAFFDGFAHADALAFRVKSTDVFEMAKGAGNARWGVRLVDAKFALPPQEAKSRKGSGAGGPTEGEEDGEAGEERMRRRFVSLDSLEYPAEHDDVTVAFEREADRDAFAAALPAPTTVPRSITLKRRI